MSWIHLDDWVGLVLWLLENDTLRGPVNLTAPQPVRNRQFARALGRAMGRPSLLPVPAFALRLMLGELADTALLSGQRVLPAAALAAGFSFRYPDVDSALRAIYTR